MNLTNFLHKLNKETLKLLGAFDEERLKIGIISYYFEQPTISGVGIHARWLAEFLVKNNCEVHVFCSNTDYQSYREKNVIVHNIGRTFLNVNGSSSKKRLEYLLFESEVVKEVIRENTKRKFDILHTHGSITKAAFILKKVCGIKWIHTFHAIEKSRIKKLSKEENQFDDLVSWIESTVNFCDGASYVSNAVLKQGKKLYDIKSNIVIHNGVDTDFFKYAPIRKKNVLFIGRFSKEKGVELLPELVENIMTIKDATITILAPYNVLPKDMQHILNKLLMYEKKYAGRIKLITKAMDQKYTASLYKNCQVYIQPSKYESFATCILEAMATGRPVVAPNVGGIPEEIGDAGFVVNNNKELISKVKELLENKEECIKIGKQANIRVKNFEWDNIAKKTVDFYRVILHE